MLFGSDGPLVPLGIGGQGEIHDGMSIPKRSKAVESFGSFDFCCVERSLERGVCENACIPAHEQLSACMASRSAHASGTHAEGPPSRPYPDEARGRSSPARQVPTRQAHTQSAYETALALPRSYPIRPHFSYLFRPVPPPPPPPQLRFVWDYKYHYS